MTFNPYGNAGIGSRGVRIGTNKANAAGWQHPKGHASWCSSAVPFNRHASVGDTVMSRPQCSCPKNQLAKHLRSLGRIER